MRNKINKNAKKIELLAPAGNMAALRAAVDARADAVYFGLEGFNMREHAKNFTLSDLDEINKICGSKVKKYLTLNTIVYDNEIGEVERLIKSVKGSIDAIICWDLSVIKLCRKYKIPIHISTQASVANREAALFYKNLGAERIILARELDLKQIEEIAKVIDVEVFAHGAMCVAVSGRCFTSGFLFGKSANRGMCMHPCRRAYTITDDEGRELKIEHNRVMSAKDLCTLPLIEDIKRSGVVAIKIEGRSRPAEYVSKVVSVYRKALDNKMTRENIISGMKELDEVYNRGFSSGFYLGKPTVDDFSSSHHGEAKESKHFVGKVNQYWPKAGVAAVQIKAGRLRIGDEVYITSDKTGLKRAKIESMEINHKQVSEVKKGQVVGVKLPACKKGDDVYYIMKKR